MTNRAAFLLLSCFTGGCLLAAVVTELAKLMIGGQ